ncbi:ABC transporter ATP-binding protein [Ammonifex thiophilus]|uniref:ABC transporter ATP-binding protein n=1 Tax=Ammonifex thiophilus TaxID=444093 RepID=UPI00196B6B1A|nr:ABC transporter ATP-binding protein [Ammonifex thiophilus]
MVLKNIDLVVQYGEIVGIIGPNASGKTLLLRLISGLAYPDAGKIVTGGKTIGPQKGGTLADVGVLIETPGFLPHLSGKDNLRLLAMLRGKIGDEEIDAAMERVGLNPTDRRPVKAYSLGMRQRLGIAQAIMESPSIILLDEPTNSLDPEYSESFLAMLRELRDRGTAIVMTSHELEEVKAVADRILTLKNGVLS